MSKLFVKDRVVPDYIIDDILYDLESIPGMPSQVAEYDLESIPGKLHGTVSRDRSSVSRVLRAEVYADLCKILENLCQSIDAKHIPSQLILKEFEHLKYGISDHFKAHRDVLPTNNPKKIRRFTTVTLLHKTEDLEGGDLIIYDKNGEQINIELEVGETVIFYSSAFHKVTPITKGGREVLVGWIYDR